jgi:hypothetical protein
MPCRFDEIVYNGYKFRNFPKATLNTEAVKDDGGNIIKYHRNTLEVEFIITMETCQIVQSFTDGSVDWDIQRIRQALLTANKSISLVYRGIGNGSQLLDNMKTPSFGGDMDCQPEVLTWEPLAANKAVRCRWRCVFLSQQRYASLNHENVRDDLKIANDTVGVEWYRIPANPQIQDTQWNWQAYIRSVTEEQEVDINTEGLLELTLKGTIEFSSINTKTKTDLKNFAQLPNQAAPYADLNKVEEYLTEPTSRRSIAQDLARYFEPYLPLGFTRKQRYVYNKTQRQLEYVIVDTEQVNPRGKFPRIINYTASHTVESTLTASDSFTQPQGFLSWANSFKGSFTVAPGYWKGWAYVAMLVLVKQRILNSTTLVGDVQKQLKDEVDAAKPLADQDVDQKNRKKLTPKHFLTDVSITEQLHENKVDVSLRYIVLTSLNDLFAKTGLFTRVRSLFTNGDGGDLPDGQVPGTHPSTWVPQSWNKILTANKLHDRISTNAVGYNGLGLADYNIIFDPSNLNLPSIDNDRGVPMPAWVGPPQSGNGLTPTATVIQEPDNYAAYRRQKHYVEHPLGVFQESTPTNPQPTNEVTGKPPVTSGTPTPTPYPGKETTQSTWMQNLDPSQSWVDYKVNFELVEVSNASYLPTIQAAPLSEIKGELDPTASGNPSDRYNTAMTINNKITAEGAESGEPNASRYSDHLVVAHGKPTYYLKFTGKAVRIGYRIPMPVVGGLQNISSVSPVVLDVYRVGKQYWSQRQVAQSADMPVFEAEWSMTYAIQGDPTCTNISFKHLRQSEFV